MLHRSLDNRGARRTSHEKRVRSCLQPGTFRTGTGSVVRDRASAIPSPAPEIHVPGTGPSNRRSVLTKATTRRGQRLSHEIRGTETERGGAQCRLLRVYSRDRYTQSTTLGATSVRSPVPCIRLRGFVRDPCGCVGPSPRRSTCLCAACVLPPRSRRVDFRPGRGKKFKEIVKYAPRLCGRLVKRHPPSLQAAALATRTLPRNDAAA